MAIDKDIRVNIEEIKAGASVEGFGNLLYLTKSGMGGSVTAGTITEYADVTSLTADSNALKEVKEISSVYFGAWNKPPSKLIVGKYGTADGTKPKDIFLKAIENRKEFFIVMTDETAEEADILELAKVVDANKKLYFLQFGENKTIVDGTYTNSLFDKVEKLNIKNSAFFYGQGVKLAVASASYLASTDLGEAGSSFTLKFKQPSGVTASVLDATKEQNLRDHNINYLIEEFKNTKAIIKNGVMSGGTPIDKVQAINFIRSKIQVDMFNYLINNKKVAMSEDGYAKIERRIETTLKGFVESGILSKGQVPINGEDTLINNYRIDMPNANALSPDDRAKGIIKGVKVYLAYAYAVVELNIDVIV